MSKQTLISNSRILEKYIVGISDATKTTKRGGTQTIAAQQRAINDWLLRTGEPLKNLIGTDY